MIRPQATPEPLTGTGLPIDHIGIVVHDLASEVAAWRAAGFQVSDPVPLMASGPDGKQVPLGQSSAHIVFSNGYVELSSPVAGSANHLEPYLAQGEGVRILVLAADDAEAARLRLLQSWPGLSPVREASRRIVVADRDDMARFHWFPLPDDVLPGVLTAVVEHRSRDLVLHPSFTRHPNGWTSILRVTGEGRLGPLLRLLPALGTESDSPELALMALGGPVSITGLTLGAENGREQSFRLA